MRAARIAAVALLLLVAIGYWLLVPPGMLPLRAFDDDVNPADTRARHAALARAQVFKTHTVQSGGPHPGRRHDTQDDPIDCRFVYTEVTGTTPKFDCVTGNGERIRVKYGTTGEVHAEVAATHLLTALGFGADDVTMTRRVRCYGCPRWPFLSRQVAGRLHLSGFLEKRIDYDNYFDFEWVSVESRERAKDLEFGNEEGWAFHELSLIDAAAGGATSAEVDALRLMAMFLDHWDNKAPNQRLSCDPDCDRPLAMLQDVGSTFGPHKVDLQRWTATPIWADAATCTLSMKEFPYEGGTFTDVSISDEGRRFLAVRLRQLDAPRIRTLFDYARFDDVEAWVAAFERRVAEIERATCPR